MDIWFTSDHHFGHKNVIKYCDRPFKDVHEMNRTMTERWNEVVKPGDTVYYLGDFAFCKKNQLSVYLSKLNGNKILIRGNHDRGIATMLDSGFQECYNRETLLQIDKWLVKLHHFPYLYQGDTAPEYEIKYKEKRPIDDGKWLLCGHIHEKWKQIDRMINVGVDVWDFYPVHIDTIKELIGRGKQLHRSGD